MPKFKKINFLFSTLMIVLSLFTGCNKTSSKESNAYHDPTYNPFGKYEETVKIKGVMEYLAHNDSRVPSHITPDNQKFITFLKDELNIEFEYMWKVPSSQYENKLSGTLLSRKYPDILKVSASQYANFKEEGILKDLTEAYKYASPDVKKFLERDKEVIDELKDEDGKIYAIPQYEDTL
jgi:putative aldouronate transport system substrate-binding protein